MAEISSLISQSDLEPGRPSVPIVTRKDVLKELNLQTEKVSKLAKGDNLRGSLNLNNASIDRRQSSIQTDEVLIDSNINSDQSNDYSTLKRPDKILPCPRCKSMNTKFCYFNNHNINQPRHYCKNCQRYWTSGGSMRNVPVGSGKRKSKHSIISVDENCEKASSPLFINPGCPEIEKTSIELQSTQTCFPLQGFPGPPWAYPWALPMIMAPPTNVPFPYFPMLPVFSNMPNLGNQCSSDEGKEEKKTFWIPKTLRVDNPEEAAKSSIWSTLGIKRDVSAKKQCLFQNFGPDEENSGCGAPNAAQMLYSNPAALARSRTFQESV